MAFDESDVQEPSLDPKPPDEYETETLRAIAEDARRVHDEQLVAINDVDDKRWRLLQFNGIVGTIAMAGSVNVGGDAKPPAIAVFLLGIGAIGLSTYLLLYAHPSGKAVLGPSRDKINQIIDIDATEAVYLHWVAVHYYAWTEVLQQRVKDRSSNVNRAKTLSVIGTGMVIGGGLIHVAIHLQ